jgi:hypothetical protein
MTELQLEERLDIGIDKCLKRLLFLRGPQIYLTCILFIGLTIPSGVLAIADELLE